MSDAEVNAYNKFEAKFAAPIIARMTKIPLGVKKIENTDGINWKNQLAIQRYYNMKMLIGLEPNMIDKNNGGAATWFRVKTKVPNQHGDYGYYDRIEILDDAVLHTKPVNHADFFYVFMKMRIKPEKVGKLQDITDSMYYYGRGGVLHSTCGEMEASMATFAIAKMWNHSIFSAIELREFYNVIIKSILGEYFANEKKASQAGHNNPYLFPHPIRDSVEEYIFSTDKRALLYGGLGGLTTGGITYAATKNPLVSGAAAIGGGLLGYGLSGGFKSNPGHNDRSNISHSDSISLAGPKGYFKPLIKYESCVLKVKAKGTARNPFAVCHKSVGGETISEIKKAIQAGKVSEVMISGLTRSQFNDGLSWIFKLPMNSPIFDIYWNQYLTRSSFIYQPTQVPNTSIQYPVVVLPTTQTQTTQRLPKILRSPISSVTK